MSRISANPQIAYPYSTLEALVAQALRRYGEMYPASADGDVYMMFISFANEVIDMITLHPYWTGDSIDYYTHVTDIRPIPDNIMILGLAYHYAEQQGSQKMPVMYQRYCKKVNEILYRMKYGKSVRHELGAVDVTTPEE